MNRVVLIGNGFDRSLDMPTKYTDFLSYYFRETLKKMFEKNNTNFNFTYKDTFLNIDITNTFSHWLRRNIERNDFTYLDYLAEIEQLGIKKEPVLWTNRFISILYSDYREKKWVEIEKRFFQYLIDVEADSIDSLNEAMHSLTSSLKKYLSTLDFKIPKDSPSYFKKVFFSNSIFFDNNFEEWIAEKQTSLNEVIIINFNYTDYLTKILKSNILNQKYSIYNIHGKLEDENQIIFGYGNETHPGYKKIESFEDNQFLRFIKSSYYALSSNYQSIITKLRGSEYEVFVYGLSCGLSDKILLNLILENDNCKQIRLFHFNDNFVDTYNNISRSFDKKDSLREKIIQMQPNDLIKQFNQSDIDSFYN